MKVRIDEIKIGNRFRKHLGDISSLKTSIEKLGLLHPIVISPDKHLLCGRRRVEAYRELGRDQIEATILDINDFLSAVSDENVIREDFSPSDAVEIAAAIEEREKELAKERQIEAGKHGTEGGRGKKKKPSVKLTEGLNKEKPSEKRSKQKAAKAVGMSRNSLAKAQVVVQAAKEEPEGYGDLVEGMDKSGKISQAYNELLRRQEAEKALLAANGINDENILIGDFREVGNQIEDGSVSLVFTDPPYSKDSMDLYGSLGEFALRTLKDGGSLLCYVGQYAIPEVLEKLSKSLRYWWIICCKHEGPSARLFGWHVRIAWKPILWFVKGSLPSEFPMITDFVNSAKPDKSGHKWAQSIVEAKYYIEYLTYTGEVVCDPFLGGGTTCMAAESLNRKYIGIEKDLKQAQIAKGRIHEFGCKT